MVEVNSKVRDIVWLGGFPQKQLNKYGGLTDENMDNNKLSSKFSFCRIMCKSWSRL